MRAPTLRLMNQAAIWLLMATLCGSDINVATAGSSAPPNQPDSRASAMDLRLPGIPARQSDHEILLRNTDALIGAKLWLTHGSKQPAFVYVDVGATESTLRWQGLAGLHGGHGIDLLGGWRHVTRHYTAGSGFDSLDFDGPFLGATLAL